MGNFVPKAVGLVVAFSVFATTMSPATADTLPAVDLSDAGSIIQRFAPEIAPETAPWDMNEKKSSAARQAPQAAAPRPIRESGGRPVVTPVPPADNLTAVSITAQDSRGAGKTSGNYQVLDSANPAEKTYVQPTSNGVRFINVLGADTGKRKFSYAVDLPVGTVAHESGSGGLALQSPDGDIRLSVDKPWAKDASGRQLQTTYEWSDGVLTQKVDFDSSGVDFPVLIDPGFSYVHTYDVANVSPRKAWDAMHSCFNCIFPIEGAPRQWPAIDQYMPLRAGFTDIVTGNFNVYFRTQWLLNSVGGKGKDSMGFLFEAAPGHVDGPGSTISFDLIKPVGQGTKLYVRANVTNDFGILNGPYTLGAQVEWARFASNLKLKVPA